MSAEGLNLRDAFIRQAEGFDLIGKGVWDIELIRHDDHESVILFNIATNRALPHWMYRVKDRTIWQWDSHWRADWKPFRDANPEEIAFFTAKFLELA